MGILCHPNKDVHITRWALYVTNKDIHLTCWALYVTLTKIYIYLVRHFLQLISCDTGDFFFSGAGIILELVDAMDGGNAERK